MELGVRTPCPHCGHEAYRRVHYPDRRFCCETCRHDERSAFEQLTGVTGRGVYFTGHGWHVKIGVGDWDRALQNGVPLWMVRGLVPEEERLHRIYRHLRETPQDWTGREWFRCEGALLDYLVAVGAVSRA